MTHYLGKASSGVKGIGLCVGGGIFRQAEVGCWREELVPFTALLLTRRTGSDYFIIMMTEVLWSHLLE